MHICPHASKRYQSFRFKRQTPSVPSSVEENLRQATLVALTSTLVATDFLVLLLASVH